MALTPYILALWQTKTGKVIISCLLIYLIGGTIIMMFKWWTIAIVAVLILAIYLQYKQDVKNHQKKLKELEDEFERIQKLSNGTNRQPRS